MPKVMNLKAVREAKFLSQRELAKVAGVSPSTVAELESGRSEAQGRTIRKLAAALGVDPQELLDPE